MSKILGSPISPPISSPLSSPTTAPVVPQVCRSAPRALTCERESTAGTASKADMVNTAGTDSNAHMVNTAGTVRVNPSANLEIYIANFEWCLAACFFVLGLGLLLKAFRLYSFSIATAVHKFLLALTCLYLSTRMPGIFTWFILGDTSNINLFS